MSREIKFRAIHKLTLKKWYEEDLVFHDGKWYEDWRAFEDGMPLNLEQCAVVQCTGLKDKNGVEIYEGDIVSDQYANIYTPIFRNGIYMAYNVECLHLTEQEPSTQFNVVWKNGCEIIGNIYENPELLKGANK